LGALRYRTRPVGRMRRSSARAGPYSSAQLATSSWLRRALSPAVVLWCDVECCGVVWCVVLWQWGV
jgi:hypothetical protein